MADSRQKCTRIGCGKSFDPASNSGADCSFHPGSPLFHEGLKSYTCCKDTNKPVLSFDEFLAIPGCTSGSHSSEKSEVKAPVVTAPSAQNGAEAIKVGSQAGSATNGTTSAPPVAASTSSGSHLATQGPSTYRMRPASPATASQGTGAKAAFVEDQDPEGVEIASGARCKRAGCGLPYNGQARESEECAYHPLPAIFHEGSKGYACCKRRVLEFDEFLKIEGCKKGKHLFIGQPKGTDGEEERVECRSDMYQTPSQVIASVFGKGADKTRSSITFDEWEMTVDLYLPANKRHCKTFALYGPIDAASSTYRIMGTKAEMTLMKADGRSWPALEAPNETEKVKTGKYGQSQITFGVTGRTGTSGAKEMVYNGDVVHG